MEYLYLIIPIAIVIKAASSCRRRFKKFQLTRKHVIITGGGSGLGRELARECCYKGAKVTLIGRNKSQLLQTLNDLEPSSRRSNFGSFVQIFDIDLAKTDQFEETLNAAENRFGPVYLFLACAGSTDHCSFLESTPKSFREQMEDNYLSLVNSLIPVSKLMASRKKGRICVVSAAECYAPMPGNPAWVASKAAVHALANCIRPELEKCQVHLSVFAPGPMDTPGYQKIEQKKGKLRKKAEGSLVSVEAACTELLRGVAVFDKYITIGYVNRLLRIVTLGATDRSNSLLDILLSPLAMIVSVVVQKYNFHKLGY